MVLFLLINLLLSTSAYANIEGDALYALRKSVKDPKNVLQSWDPTLVDPCTWFHVTCDSEHRVTRLDLGNAKLSGNLVPELGKLEHLEYLELYMNNFVGTIPYQLGGLKNLISLDLFHNNLTGFIPPSLSKLSKIRFLRLNGNNLTGQIPRDLTKLHNLKILDVSDNDLSGTFPTWGSFSKLTEESFKNNPRLEGPKLMGSVRRDRAASTYRLYLGLSLALTGDLSKLLLAAKKVRKATGIEFMISLAADDFSRATYTYVGKLSNNTTYPTVIPTHPSDPNQFTLGMNDGSVHVIEPTDANPKWGGPGAQDNSTLA